MIYINNDKDIDGMRLAGYIASQTLDYMESYVREGANLEWLNELAHNFIVSHIAVPAPLNYNCFPKSVCISVNDVATHGVAHNYNLKDNDIVTIDVTVIKEGYHGDTSRTFIVGCGQRDQLYISNHTYLCLCAGIKAVKPGAPFSDIGKAITKEHNRLCEENDDVENPSLLKDVFGHGIGKEFHSEPLIPHYTRKFDGVMQEGMCFTIEPCFSMGSAKTHLAPDGWSNRTVDGSITAQWEHTVLVTSSGCEVLTIGYGDGIPRYI